MAEAILISDLLEIFNAEHPESAERILKGWI